MNIQGNINQTIGLGAAALRLSPGYDERSKEYALKERIKALDKQINTIYDGPDKEGGQGQYLQAQNDYWSEEDMKKAYRPESRTTQQLSEDLERNKQLEALGEEKKEALLSSSNKNTMEHGYNYAGKLAIYGERNRMARSMIEKEMRQRANEGLKARLENQMDEKTWMRVYREAMGGSNG